MYLRWGMMKHGGLTLFRQAAFLVEMLPGPELVCRHVVHGLMSKL